MPELGLFSGRCALLLIKRRIIPEADDGLDPRFHFLGRRQNQAHRREPLRQGKKDTAIAQGLGNPAAVPFLNLTNPRFFSLGPPLSAQLGVKATF